MGNTMSENFSAAQRAARAAANQPAKKSVGQTVQAASTAPAATTTTPPATTGQTVPATDLTKEFASMDEQTAAYQKRMNEILEEHTGVDIERFYTPLLRSLESQPTPQAPGRATTFFAALGAPNTAPAILNAQRESAEKAGQDKHEKLLSLREAITQGQVQQAMQEQNFSKAQKLSVELENLHVKQKLISDTLKATAKAELQTQREGAAMARLRERLKTDRELAALQNDRIFATAYQSAITRLLTDSDNLTGELRHTPDKAVELAINAGKAAVAAVGAAQPSPQAGAGQGGGISFAPSTSLTLPTK